jgi:hypothetical protein
MKQPKDISILYNNYNRTSLNESNASSSSVFNIKTDDRLAILLDQFLDKDS